MAGKLQVIIDRQYLISQITNAIDGMHIKPIKLQVEIDTKQAEKKLKNLADISKTNVKVGAKQSSSYKQATTRIRSATAMQENDDSIFLAKISKAQAKVESYFKKNGALKSNSGLYNEYKQIVALSKQIGDSTDLKNFNAQWSAYTEKVKAAGLAHKTLGESMKSAFGNLSRYFSAGQLIASFTNQVKQAVSDLKTYDTILTEISKTSNRTQEQLNATLEKAYPTANKYGTTVEGYLTGIQEMSRAGFQGEQADKLAELSVLAQSAGDMTADLANQYLIATNAAYQLNGSYDALNAVLDGQNIITNKNAVNMTELAEATKIVASQANSSGISIDEMTAALGTMIASTQQGGAVAARAFKGILMNLQGVTGEVEDGEIIQEEDLNKYEKACDALGVSLKEVRNGALSVREPMVVLKELANAYNALPEGDARKADLLSSVGGKYRANQLDALLKNWSTYEKMLSEYSQGAGSAAEEAAKTADSVQGRLNSVGNSFNQMVGQFVNSDLMKFTLGVSEGFLQATNSVVQFTGAFPALITAITGFMSFKSNKGKVYAPLPKVFVESYSTNRQSVA